MDYSSAQHSPSSSSSSSITTTTITTTTTHQETQPPSTTTTTTFSPPPSTAIIPSANSPQHPLFSQQIAHEIEIVPHSPPPSSTITTIAFSAPPSTIIITSTNSPQHLSSSQQITQPEIASLPHSLHSSSTITTITSQHPSNEREIVPDSALALSPLEIQTATENQQSRPQTMMQRTYPYIFMLIIQALFAIMNILMKLAINNGISNYVFVVYRNGIASLLSPIALYVDRNIRPAMTIRIFGKILLLSQLGITFDQNLYFAGMKLTTPTFAAALSNTIPTITFVLAVIFRMENLIIRNRPSQAKVVGTLIALSGATIMTLVKGPVLYGSANSHHSHGGGISFLGIIYLLLGCLSTAGSTIFSKYAFNNANNPWSDDYPQLSLTALVCLCGTIEGIIVAIVMEDRNPSKLWSYFNWDMLLLTAVYTGIFCSGLGFYLRLKVIQARDSTFASAFSPLCMIMVTVASVLLFGTLLSLGSVLGSVIISLGLLCLLWGNAQDKNNRPAAAEEGTV